MHASSLSPALLIRPPSCRTNFGSTPLAFALASKSVPLVKLLLKQPGIDCAAVDGCGRTLLMHAARSGSAEVRQDSRSTCART